MKKLVFIMTCIFLTGVGFQSCKQSDDKLQKEVEKVLKDNYSNISSTVKDGVATLNGTVETEEQKAAIGSVVGLVKNIKSVTNNITVQAPEPTVVISPDETIKTAINTAFVSAGFKDVVIDVKDGEVTLTGNVKRADLKKVMQIANESNPKKVVNKLTIK